MNNGCKRKMIIRRCSRQINVQLNLTEKDGKSNTMWQFFSNILNKIEDMSDKVEDYIEAFLLELENYDFTINRKKVATSAVKN